MPLSLGNKILVRDSRVKSIQIEGSLQMPQEELTPEQEEIVKAALKLASLSAKESEDGAENTKNPQRSADNHNGNTSHDKENTNTAAQRKTPPE